MPGDLAAWTRDDGPPPAGGRARLDGCSAPTAQGRRRRLAPPVIPAWYPVSRPQPASPQLAPITRLSRATPTTSGVTMTSSLSFENTFDLLQQALEETEVAVAGADDGGNGQRIGERENGRVPRGWTLKHSCHTQANRRGECAGGKTCKHRRCCEQTHLDVMPHGENNGQRRGVASWVPVVRARRVLRAGPTLRPVASLPRNQALAAPFA